MLVYSVTETVDIDSRL